MRQHKLFNRDELWLFFPRSRCVYTKYLKLYKNIKTCQHCWSSSSNWLGWVRSFSVVHWYTGRGTFKHCKSTSLSRSKFVGLKNRICWYGTHSCSYEIIDTFRFSINVSAIGDCDATLLFQATIEVCYQLFILLDCTSIVRLILDAESYP